MTKPRKDIFKLQPHPREITIQIFIILTLPLSFKIRTKIGECTLAKPHAIFQSFLLEMLVLFTVLRLVISIPNYQGVLKL